MDNLDKFLSKISYKFPKGYPDMEDPKDVKMLFELVSKVMVEQEEETNPEIPNKQEIIKIIQDTELTDSQLTKLKNIVSKIGFTGPIEDYLDVVSKESNIPKNQILKFLNLLSEEGIEKEFAEYIQNPVAFDLTAKNFTELIPGIPKDKLLSLYRDMGSAIVNNVSIGPGEVLFSILFNNTKKRDSKGDLDVGGKNIELKASTKGAGAVIAKGYNRGQWSNTRKSGKFDEFVKGLGMGEEATKDALKNLDRSLRWPTKLSIIYDEYSNSEAFDKNKFISGVENILSRIYNKSSWTSKGEYFDLKKYFSDTDFEETDFIVDLTKELVKEYMEYEGFDGMLFSDKHGNIAYLEGDNVINGIGKDIKIAGPSDDVPRLVLKV